jgi:hypothetical protein
LSFVCALLGPREAGDPGGFWSGRVTRLTGPLDSRWLQGLGVAVRGVLAWPCSVWLCWCGCAGVAVLGVAAAWSAVIMVGQVITEDCAGGHALGMP